MESEKPGFKNDLTTGYGPCSMFKGSISTHWRPATHHYAGTRRPVVFVTVLERCHRFSLRPEHQIPCHLSLLHWLDLSMLPIPPARTPTGELKKKTLIEKWRKWSISSWRSSIVRAYLTLFNIGYSNSNSTRVFMDVVAALQKEDSLYPLVIHFGKRKSSYLKMCSHEFTYFLGKKKLSRSYQQY